jgi:hypothetical protein
MRYLLDTNVVSDLVRNPQGRVDVGRSPQREPADDPNHQCTTGNAAGEKIL